MASALHLPICIQCAYSIVAILVAHHFKHTLRSRKYTEARSSWGKYTGKLPAWYTNLMEIYRQHNAFIHCRGDIHSFGGWECYFWMCSLWEVFFFVENTIVFVKWMTAHVVDHANVWLIYDMLIRYSHIMYDIKNALQACLQYYDWNKSKGIFMHMFNYRGTYSIRWVFWIIFRQKANRLFDATFSSIRYLEWTKRPVSDEKNHVGLTPARNVLGTLASAMWNTNTLVCRLAKWYFLRVLADTHGSFSFDVHIRW